MNEKWNQYFFGEPTEEEKRELFQELEKNEDMKREFAEMQNIVGLSGLSVSYTHLTLPTNA